MFHGPERQYPKQWNSCGPGHHAPWAKRAQNEHRLAKQPNNECESSGSTDHKCSPEPFRKTSACQDSNTDSDYNRPCHQADEGVGESKNRALPGTKVFPTLHNDAVIAGSGFLGVKKLVNFFKRECKCGREPYKPREDKKYRQATQACLRFSSDAHTIIIV